MIEMEDLRLREVYLDVQGAESNKSPLSPVAEWPLLPATLPFSQAAGLVKHPPSSQVSDLSNRLLPFHSPCSYYYLLLSELLQSSLR